MRYLGLALFAEGATDHRFLRPLLRRRVQCLCLASCPEEVEINDPLELHTPSQVADRSRAERVVAAAKEAEGGFSLLFIHTDGGADHRKAVDERVQPAIDLLTRAMSGREGVGVVPVRETEAWALADVVAIQSAFGTTLGARALDLPDPPKMAEGVADPKAALDRAYVLSRGGRKTKRRGRDFLDLIGQEVSFDTLQQLAAFRRFDSVRALGGLDPAGDPAGVVAAHHAGRGLRSPSRFCSKDGRLPHQAESGLQGLQSPARRSR